jgi:hypothetical protein
VRLVDGPEAWGGEFEEVGVGIAEVDALAIERPVDATLDGDGVGGQVGFPGGESGFGNRERYMELAGAAVGRDDAAGDREREGGFAAFEEQQDVARGYGVSAEAFVSGDALEAEDFFVEVRGAVEVVYVERGFQDTGEWRSWGHVEISSWMRG